MLGLCSTPSRKSPRPYGDTSALRSLDAPSEPMYRSQTRGGLPAYTLMRENLQLFLGTASRATYVSPRLSTTAARRRQVWDCHPARQRQRHTGEMWRRWVACGSRGVVYEIQPCRRSTPPTRENAVVEVVVGWCCAPMIGRRGSTPGRRPRSRRYGVRYTSSEPRRRLYRHLGMRWACPRWTSVDGH